MLIILYEGLGLLVINPKTLLNGFDGVVLALYGNGAAYIAFVGLSGRLILYMIGSAAGEADSASADSFIVSSGTWILITLSISMPIW